MIPGEELLFCALGGSGEIGMNVNLYGCRGQWIMVDLGLTFADPDYPGIELILPDLEFIERQQDRLAGIVLTHGHEDHIGALPYLAEDLKVPLFATPFTAGLIAGKLEEEGLTGHVKLNVVERGGSIDLGPFRVRFVALSHSIPEGNGLLIETPFGNVFHTGDWKIDETPVLGEPASTDVLTQDRRQGVLALVCDSTNVFQDQGPVRKRASTPACWSRSQGQRARARHHLRLQRRAAADHRPRRDRDRAAGLRRGPFARPHPAGRSSHRLSSRFPRAGELRRGDAPAARGLLIVATGGQGEPRAALGRLPRAITNSS